MTAPAIQPTSPLVHVQADDVFAAYYTLLDQKKDFPLLADALEYLPAPFRKPFAQYLALVREAHLRPFHFEPMELIRFVMTIQGFSIHEQRLHSNTTFAFVDPNNQSGTNYLTVKMPWDDSKAEIKWVTFSVAPRQNCKPCLLSFPL